MALAYKKRLAETLERLRNLYEERPEDRIFAVFDMPSQALSRYLQAHPQGFCDYPDPRERAAFWDSHLKERRDILDDGLPIAYLSEFDQGLYGGLVNGQVEFMLHDNGWVSSMTRPILRDWSELPALKIDPSHSWFRRYLAQMRIFREAAEGRFGISHFIMIDGLNFTFELVGATQTYLSLFEEPESVREAMRFAFDLNLLVQNAFFEQIPLLEGGTCSNMGQWIPGRIVSESVDPFHMTGCEWFERWGRENVEAVFGAFDGGVLHLHGNGRHLLEAVADLKGLKAVLLGDDKDYPPAFDVLPELRRKAGSVPLVVRAEFEDFRQALNESRLPSCVLYKVVGAKNIDAANRCMEQVLSYHA